MMNSFQKSVKYLRSINLKTALNTLKECNPAVRTLQKTGFEVTSNSRVVTFSPRSINFEIGQKIDESKIKHDPMTYTPIINPRSILPIIDSGWKREEIGLPTPAKEEKQAVRLIVIRRKKMKKHQRRKLWKKMRHRWARIRQKRRQIKEKKYQSELLALIKQAHEFSAESYVADKITRANFKPLTTNGRYKHLPEFIVRQIVGLDKKINYKHTDNYKA